MIKKQRHHIEQLSALPIGAEFVIGGRYARIDKDKILEIFYFNSGWSSTNQTLEQYNDYWEKEPKEYNMEEFIKRYFNVRTQWSVPKNFYFYYDQLTQRYYISYNKPIVKGFAKNASGQLAERTKSGERRLICKETYPQIIRLVESTENKVFDLFAFQDKVRQEYEMQLMIKGEMISGFDKEFRMYSHDSALTMKVNNVIETELNKLMGIE